MNRYKDRKEAGVILADYLKSYSNRKDVLILGLPRGGVPVAYEVAKVLNVPLDVFIVRKLGVPGHEELAMGAMATGGLIVLNDKIMEELSIPPAALQKVMDQEQQELNRREEVYRNHRPLPEMKNKTIILIDDGIATGATMTAAIKALRQLNPHQIIVAVPVAEITTCEKMAKITDQMICPMKLASFYAVGAHYDTFDQTTDEEVTELLKREVSS